MNGGLRVTMLVADEDESAPVPVRVWDRPVLVAIGDATRAGDLAAMAARAAHNTDGMVVIFTIDDSAVGDDGAASDALKRASCAVDRYRVPYRVDVERHRLSGAGVDRSRELAWYIADRASRWGAGLVVVGAPDGVDPRVEVHRHLVAVCPVPVVPIGLPAHDRSGVPMMSAG